MTPAAPSAANSGAVCLLSTQNQSAGPGCCRRSVRSDFAGSPASAFGWVCTRKSTTAQRSSLRRIAMRRRASGLPRHPDVLPWAPACRVAAGPLARCCLRGAADSNEYRCRMGSAGRTMWAHTSCQLTCLRRASVVPRVGGDLVPRRIAASGWAPPKSSSIDRSGRAFPAQAQRCMGTATRIKADA